MVGVQTLYRKSAALEDALGARMRSAFDASKGDDKFAKLLAQLKDEAQDDTSPPPSTSR